VCVLCVRFERRRLRAFLLSRIGDGAVPYGVEPSRTTLGFEIKYYMEELM
jgi:hypothetical protein